MNDKSRTTERKMSYESEAASYIGLDIGDHEEFSIDELIIEFGKAEPIVEEDPSLIAS
jgi:hypothetical protein